MHGDLGVVAAGDVVVALSASGETEEVVALLPAACAARLFAHQLVWGGWLDAGAGERGLARRECCGGGRRAGRDTEFGADGFPPP